MTIDIIIPMMDRAGDLERSLHTLLAQDYEHYRVYIVDMGSTDHLDEVLHRQSSDRLRLIRCRRPDVFSFSRSRNLGARHSNGQFLLFLNGDNYLQDSTVLSRMLRDLASGEGDSDWYDRWRKEQGYAAMRPATPAGIPSTHRYRFAHCDGSPLLVERVVFDAVGGYNELLSDWGFEDTDLIGRLQLAGCSRVAMTGIGVTPPPDEDRVRVTNFINRDRWRTWALNRLLSDYMIRRWGVVAPADEPETAQDECVTSSDTAPADPSRSLRLTAAEREAVESLRTTLATVPTEWLNAPDEQLMPLTVIVRAHGRDALVQPTVDSIRREEYPYLEVVVDGNAQPASWFDGRGPALSEHQAAEVTLGTGDLVTAIDAGELWRPGSARAAVSAFLADNELWHLADAVTSQSEPSQSSPGAAAGGAGSSDAPQAARPRKWLHRPRALAMTVAGMGSGPSAGQLWTLLMRAWVREQGSSGKIAENAGPSRCYVSLGLGPDLKRMRIGIVSVARKIRWAGVSVNESSDGLPSGQWKRMPSVRGGDRVVTAELDFPEMPEPPGEHRVAVRLTFDDRTELPWFRQPRLTVGRFPR